MSLNAIRWRGKRAAVTDIPELLGSKTMYMFPQNDMDDGCHFIADFDEVILISAYISGAPRLYQFGRSENKHGGVNVKEACNQ